MKSNLKLINSINNRRLTVKGTFVLKKNIESRFDVGYLFKDVYLNGEFLTDSLWIYKSEISKKIIDKLSLNPKKTYSISGAVSNIPFYKNGKKLKRFVFAMVTNISEYLNDDISEDLHDKRIKKKPNILKCPKCHSLNVQKVRKNWYYCEICSEEFKKE